MAMTTRSRLTGVRVLTATAGDAKHAGRLFDGLGSNGLYLHLTPAGAKCRAQQLMAPNPASGKSRRVRIGLGASTQMPRSRYEIVAEDHQCSRRTTSTAPCLMPTDRGAFFEPVLRERSGERRLHARQARKGSWQAHPFLTTIPEWVIDYF